jgi:glycosyltransferase involved in cell wall biosynthesis
MRFVQITPGSGDHFYCENCLRDLDMIRALQGHGLDVVMVPLYLPIQGAGETPLFYGGVNVYLQQKLSLFRKTPRWLDRLFDSRGLLRWAGRKAGMTSAADLGQTTASMLQGRDGRQAKELDRLAEWLCLPQNRPDVVCLSDALLLGLAQGLRERLKVPVVCLLQDEDGFVDGLGSPYSGQVWDLMRQCGRHVDCFVAVSAFYAGLMKVRMAIPEGRIHVVPMGVDAARYQAAKGPPPVPTIGFLSRQCPDRGLDRLVEAFLLLKRQERFRPLRLHISGGRSQADEPFVRKMCDHLARAHSLDDVAFHTDFSFEARQEFLRGLTVLAVPEKTPVAYGLYVLEGLACGVPVAEPAIGVFPEILAQTGGGVLYQDNTGEGLAVALEPLLSEPVKARDLGLQGRQGLLKHYDVNRTAEQMIALIRQLAPSI